MRIPPDLKEDEKKQVIMNYGIKYKFDTFVETGTYKGEMVEKAKKVFDNIYSVELLDNLFNESVIRFKDDKNIHLYKGNSPNALELIMPQINKATLFWLDAHDGQTSPVLKELKVIFKYPAYNHLILIDDMRNFKINRRSYPKIPEIIAFIKEHRPSWNIDIDKDIMRIGINNV